jgi:hypothetical protein
MMFIVNNFGYMTEKDDNKSAFDLSPDEHEKRLRPVTEKVRAELFARGMPVTFQDERCPTGDHFVQEFQDGRVRLVLFDIMTKEYAFVKDIKSISPHSSSIWGCQKVSFLI